MAGRLIFEVRQRSRVNPLETRELGFFTDDMLAQNSIDYLYKKAWGLVVKPDFLGSEWFPAEMRAAISGKGFDTWLSDELNSTEPIFYKVPHSLYSKVPTVNDMLLFDQEVFLVTVDSVE